MEITDQELWHILQVELPGPAKPWEKETRCGLDREAIEWAKCEVLGGSKDVGRNYDGCIVYLARLLRLLNVLAEHDIAPSRRGRTGGVIVYEESYVHELLLNGLEACGASVEKIEDVVWYATHEGFLCEEEVDDWRPGMASGSGWRKYYGLTFKGNKQAEKASLMALEREDQKATARQTGGVGAEKAEPAARSQNQAPAAADNAPEMSTEDWETAGLGLLLLLAQTYYKLLESAISMATWYAEVDPNLNGSYLWTVKSLRNLLGNHEGLKDFPMAFEPPFEDLYPSSIGDVEWQDMVAPGAERFLGAVQKYTMDKGYSAPDEGTQAWTFIELFRPSIEKALKDGESYRERMEQCCRQQFRERSQGVGERQTPNQPVKAPENGSPPPVISSEATERIGQSIAHTDNPANNTTHRSPFCGCTSYVGVPLVQIVNDLREWEQSLKQSCDFLKKKKEELQKARIEVPQEIHDAEFRVRMQEWERQVSEKVLTGDMIESAKPFLPKYSDVEMFIDRMTTYYERFELEFVRLAKELPRGVKASHAEALRQILSRCGYLNDLIREFRNDYAWFGPWSDLAHEIYVEVSDAQGNLLDIGNVATRLEALVGTALEVTDAVPECSISGDDLAKHTALIIEKVEAQPVKTAALLRGTIKQRLGTLGTVVEEDFTASPHFTNLTWHGQSYVLRRNAAVIVETLYIAQKYYGIPGMHQEEIFGQVYGADKKKWPSGNTRVQNFFRTNDAKRLWRDGCIVHDNKGSFRLNINIHT